MQPEVILAIDVGASVVTILAVVGFIMRLEGRVSRIEGLLEGYFLREARKQETD